MSTAIIETIAHRRSSAAPLAPDQTRDLNGLAKRFRPPGLPSTGTVFERDIDSYAPTCVIPPNLRHGLLVRTKHYGLFDQNRCADRFIYNTNRWILASLTTGRAAKGYRKWDEACQDLALDIPDPDALHNQAGKHVYALMRAMVSEGAVTLNREHFDLWNCRLLTKAGTQSPMRFGWLTTESASLIFDPRCAVHHDDQATIIMAPPAGARLFLYDHHVDACRPPRACDRDSWTRQMFTWMREANTSGEADHQGTTTWSRQWRITPKIPSP